MFSSRAKKSSPLSRGGLLRNLSASVAGARAGTAIAADGALNKLIPKRHSNELSRREAHRFVDKLGQLKGTYVKIGQMMALLGEHFLPEELSSALHRLHDTTEPLDWDTIEQTLKIQLGDKYSELDIERTPLAAASLAQVHRATIVSTGEQVCLKVLYPEIKDSIISDFKSVKRMLHLTRMIKTARELDLFMDDIESQLLLELDYRREAEMTEYVALKLQDDSRFQVPELYRRYCTDSLLCMSCLDGVSVTDSSVQSLSLAKRNDVAEAMLDLFFKELYDWNLIQSDPNFGNYRVMIIDNTVSLGLLDFGSMMATPATFTQAWTDAINAVRANKQTLLIEALTAMGFLSDSSSDAAKESFTRFCHKIMEPLLEPSQLPKSTLNSQGQYDWSKSNLMTRAGKQAAQSTRHEDFSLPSQEFAFVARKLTGVFTFISTLKAEFNGADVLDKYLDTPRNPS